MGPWVDELRSCWREGRERAPLARAVVDLKDVTSIDEAGEGLLREMLNAGAECTATGVATKHLLESLRNHREAQPRSGLDDLCAPDAELEMPDGGAK
jgi:hypothetical protein